MVVARSSHFCAYAAYLKTVPKLTGWNESPKSATALATMANFWCVGYYWRNPGRMPLNNTASWQRAVGLVNSKRAILDANNQCWNMKWTLKALALENNEYPNH
jgi:hypothetical protein